MANDEDELPQRDQLMNEVADWEYVAKGLHSFTQRKAVPGGWLYRSVIRENPALCFVPDNVALIEAIDHAGASASAAGAYMDGVVEALNRLTEVIERLKA